MTGVFQRHREGARGSAGWGWLSGVELRGLARFASCDAEHVAVRRAYVRHDYAFTPLSASILASWLASPSPHTPPLPLLQLPSLSLHRHQPLALFLTSISPTFISTHPRPEPPIPSAPETFPDFFSDSLGVSDRAGFNNGTPYNLRDSVTNMSRCVQIGTLLGVDARKVNSGGCEGFCFVIRILSISVLRVQR